MKPITFLASKPTYTPKVVADVTFPVMAFLGRQTLDKRTIVPSRRAQVTVRLPANIMTDHAKGPLRPGRPEITKYRMIGVLLSVTVEADRISGAGVLFKLLPLDVEFWPGVDLDGDPRFYKNGRSDLLDWMLIGVTLRDHGRCWDDLPPVTITPR